MPIPQFTVEIKDVNLENSSEVGEKAANLGEMIKAGFPTPSGFIITAAAYNEFVEQNNLRRPLKGATYARRAKLISEAALPEGLKKEIVNGYETLGTLFKNAHVAVRPSLASDIAIDSAVHSLSSVLNIKGEANLIREIKSIWARTKTAIIVQKLVDAEISGVAFTASPGNKHQMLIEAVWGLGDLATQGHVTPDRYLVERHSLKIEEVSVEEQEHQLIISGHTTKTKRVPSHRQNKQKLSESRIRELAKILQKVHAHYFFPQDVEWAISRGKFYLLHVRPAAEIPGAGYQTAGDKQEPREKSEILLQGQGASPGIVTGIVRIIKSHKQLEKVQKGEILVFKMTSPDLLPYFKKARAIITDEGGVTSHAAIITRELGLPCVVGTGKATSKLKDGEVVTVNGKEGAIMKGRGKVSKLAAGAVEKVVNIERVVEVKPQEGIKTATKIYLNLAEPEQAKNAAALPVDGVGLLRAEFTIAKIGVHPRHLLAQGRQEVFVEKLADTLVTFASCFYPRPVVYRTSDFKSNEYRNLQGGKAYEPEEENPLLGFRGAIRYIADPEVFELELAAIKKARDSFPNLWVMLPFVRSPDELLHVKRIMAASGLVRSASFKLWMMVELPVNVIQIEDFIATGIDAISFGSNDLTMLTLGLDRDNKEIISDIDPISPALIWSLKRVIKACKKARVTTSICGEAASSYDTLVETLVKAGINSISVNQDALGRVQKVIYETERRL